MSVSLKMIEEKIYFIRDTKVMLDSDLAYLYGVTTKRLKEQVNRNQKRFPADFMFRLTEKECLNLRSQNATSSWGGSRYLPYAFTELGVAMLSSVLNSERAVQMNIQIMRVFDHLRKSYLTQKELKQKINDIIRVHGGKLQEHDEQLKVLFQALDRLLEPPKEKDKKKFGFLADR